MRHKLVLQLDHRCIVFSRLQGFLRMYQTALACEAMKRSPAWTACQYSPENFRGQLNKKFA